MWEKYRVFFYGGEYVCVRGGGGGGEEKSITVRSKVGGVNSFSLSLFPLFFVSIVFFRQRWDDLCDFAEDQFLRHFFCFLKN